MRKLLSFIASLPMNVEVNGQNVSYMYAWEYPSALYHSSVIFGLSASMLAIQRQDGSYVQEEN